MTTVGIQKSRPYPWRVLGKQVTTTDGSALYALRSAHGSWVNRTSCFYMKDVSSLFDGAPPRYVIISPFIEGVDSNTIFAFEMWGSRGTAEDGGDVEFLGRFSARAGNQLKSAYADRTVITRPNSSWYADGIAVVSNAGRTITQIDCASQNHRAMIKFDLLGCNLIGAIPLSTLPSSAGHATPDFVGWEISGSDT